MADRTLQRRPLSAESLDGQAACGVSVRMRLDGGVILPFPTYLAWSVMAATLCAAGVWYWKMGHRSPQRSRRGIGFLVGVIFAVNGFVNSVWLGVRREGSLEAALSPLGWATAIVTCLLMFGLGLLMSWQGARGLRRMKERQAKQS